MINKLSSENKLCQHCGNYVGNQQSDFCCSGCLQVYQILKSSGLTNYYKIRELSNVDQVNPVNLSDETFEYFNDFKFQQEFVFQKQENIESGLLYIKGVHCAACQWLLNRLPEFCAGVLRSELNYSNSQLNMTIDNNQTSWQQVARFINKIGYYPELLQSKKNEQQKNDRKLLLLQIGVAGFSAGNTMMIAVSLYQGLFSGIAEPYRNFLHWVSLILTLPTMIFSAEHFFKKSFAMLKIRQPHLDLPISIGILLGFIYSVYATITGKDYVYFDTICMLIFLILTARYLQRLAVEKVQEKMNIDQFRLPTYARLILNDQLKETFIKSVKRGDLCLVKPNEIIPVDGEVKEGSSQVDNSFLTGESLPIRVSKGINVYAGSKNLENDLIINTSSELNEFRISKIFNSLGQVGHKSHKFTAKIDYISRGFVWVVCSLAVINFIIWIFIRDFEIALQHTIALLIITCPCALGMSAPLIIAKAVSQLATKEIFIKNLDFFDILNRCKNYFFDKTGTLTDGQFKIVDSYFKDTQKKEALLKKILILETNTQHPIKDAFFNFYKNIDIIENFNLMQFEVVAGLGINGVFSDNEKIFIGSRKFISNNGVVIEKEILDQIDSYIKEGHSIVLASNDQNLLAYFILGDEIRSNANKLIQFLNKEKKEVFILSGDNQSSVQKVADKLNIANFYSQKLPEEKADFIEKQKNLSVMVGDGFNDALALQKADIGIGVAGGSEVNMLVSDCYINSFSIEKLQNLILNTNKILKFINYNILFSLIYNVIGASLAVLGYINPLVAAILMPISSFIIIFRAIGFKTIN